ncbi:bifunctional DNA primase/polymerase [Saccharothrix syringae]|uniref:bifunctional DNA primase/polymerase n=1 Tax=Saccharothrix syringae TaxID=103733 RepID=UPI003D1567AC
MQSSTLQAALHYAELGWPVVPGAIWVDGHFADPVDQQQVTSPFLRPVEEATTDAALVHAWWTTSTALLMRPGASHAAASASCTSSAATSGPRTSATPPGRQPNTFISIIFGMPPSVIEQAVVPAPGKPDSRGRMRYGRGLVYD